MNTVTMERRGFRPWLGQVRLGAVRLAGRHRLGSTAATLTDATFSQALAAQAAVVDFWSPTCVPCMQSKPVFEDVATNPPGNLFMATVNADEATQIVAQYGVDSLPTQIYFVNGQEVGRSQGAFTKDSLLAAIAAKLPPPAGPITVEPPPNQPPPSLQPPPSSGPAPSQIFILPPPPVGPPPAAQGPAALPTAAATVTDQFSTPVIVIGVIAVAALAVGITLAARPK